ncbi:hypothetical protein [Nocardiopsis trehalosi]|uniref:hypothetical protein n=1 Tax=Nocardiopsis trehalosi TaxID=109329 RepID=UPI0008350DAA|nr:hypothetical protein [Nocardiopsis trehalosi]
MTTDPQQDGPRASDADDRSMEAAEADLTEQEAPAAGDGERDWLDAVGDGPPDDAAEADAVEQMREVGPDDEDDYR